MITPARGPPHSAFAQLCTFIYCSDLEAATKFWNGDLALPIVLDQVAPPPDGGLKCRIFGVAPTGFVGAVLVDPQTDARPRSQSLPVGRDNRAYASLAGFLRERAIATR